MASVASSDVAVDRDVPVPLCPLDEIPLGLGRAFSIAGHEVAVFRTRQGLVYALDNRCPHRGGPLADGMLAGGKVVCPMHAFRFRLDDGECDQQGTPCVTAYPVSVQAGWVRVHLLPEMIIRPKGPVARAS